MFKPIDIYKDPLITERAQYERFKNYQTFTLYYVDFHSYNFSNFDLIDSIFVS